MICNRRLDSLPLSCTYLLYSSRSICIGDRTFVLSHCTPQVFSINKTREKKNDVILILLESSSSIILFYPSSRKIRSTPNGRGYRKKNGFNFHGNLNSSNNGIFQRPTAHGANDVHYSVRKKHGDIIVLAPRMDFQFCHAIITAHVLQTHGHRIPARSPVREINY